MGLGEDKVEWPTIRITPEEIFQGKIPTLNVNFIKPVQTWSELTNGGTLEEKDVLSTESRQVSLEKLRNTIARWYMALRNISIVGLLSVLVYIGIRMMLSGVASEKAKYKQMFMDWIIALCLIFFLHYIMALTMTITEQVTGIFTNSSQASIGLMQGDVITVDGEDKTAVSNLMEYARVYVSLADAIQSCAYLIIYVWLIVYTVKFIIVYMKRFIHMAFLTLMAPLVALTYPIDKASDGKAQAFDMWLKDYMFNALIQPFHLIIYTVFVTSALEFATDNLIYACVAIGFITPAEKFLRKMFGFDRASNPPGGLGGFATGALATQAFNKLRSSGGKGGGNEANAGTPARTKPNYSGYMGNAGGTGSGGSGGSGDAPALDGGGAPDNSNPQNALPEGQDNSGGNDPNSPQGNDPNSPQNNPDEIESYSGWGDEWYAPELERGDDVDSDEIESYSTGEFDDYGYGSNVQEDVNAENDNIRQQLDTETETPAEQQAEQPNETPTPVNNDTPVRTPMNRRPEAEKREITGWQKFGAGMANIGKNRWKRALKGGAKLGLGVLGAGVGAAAMGIHALATGKDAGEIFKAGIQGATGGAMLGSASVDKAIGMAQGIADTGRNLAYEYRAGYDKEGADRALEKQRFMNDKRQEQFIKQNFTGENGEQLHGQALKERMEQSYAIYEAGITDEKTRKKVMKLEDQINGEIMDRLDAQEREKPEQIRRSRETARQQALITSELAGQYSASTLLKDQDKIRSSIEGNIRQEAQDRGVNMSQQQIEANANTALNRLADYHGVVLNNTTRTNTQTPSRATPPRNNTQTPRRNNT